MDILHSVLHGVDFLHSQRNRHCGNHSWLACSHVEPAIHSKERFLFNALTRALSVSWPWTRTKNPYDKPNDSQKSNSQRQVSRWMLWVDIPQRTWLWCADVKDTLRCKNKVLVRCFPPSFELLQKSAKPNCLWDVSQSLAAAPKSKCQWGVPAPWARSSHSPSTEPKELPQCKCNARVQNP